MEVSVRAAEPEDAELIVRFNEALARETEGRELERAVLERGVERLLEEPRRGRYFLAERRGKVAAQLLITREWSDWRNGDIWWIQSVYVDPAHRGEGLYRTLHEHVRGRAEETGAVGLRLYVDRENEDARAVYERLGMERSRYVVFEEIWRPAGSS